MTFYYEDWQPGGAIEYGSYTATKDEMLAFAEKWDPRPFHVDDAFAKTTLYGGLTGSGIMSLAVLTKLCCQATEDWAIRGALGYENFRYAVAVKVGDTLTARSEFLEKRISKSRPELGIMRSHERVTNQHGELVLEMIVSFLMQRRSYAAPAGLPASSEK